MECSGVYVNNFWGDKNKIPSVFKVLRVGNFSKIGLNVITFYLIYWIILNIFQFILKPILNWFNILKNKNK